MTAERRLVESIQGALRTHADPQRAPQMQAYMKSTMPFLGVAMPVVRGLVRDSAKAMPLMSTADLATAATALWREAAYREERYAATALTGLPVMKKLQTPDLLPLYIEMITTGAWWDHVDEVSRRIGFLLSKFPDVVRPLVLTWTTAQDRWLRRASVICQLGLRGETDLDLMTTAIEANIADRDFFLRKAIGWALRDFARTDPDWVRAFVAGHDGLSTLSRREALKHLG